MSWHTVQLRVLRQERCTSTQLGMEDSAKLI